MSYKIALPLIFTAIAISACKNETAPASIEVKPAMQAMPVYNPTERFAALRWVETANAVNDAKKALAAGDTGLWGYSSRIGPKLPGVEASEIEKTLKTHSMKKGQAMGDIVHGDEHLQLRLKFIEYAKQYNTIVLAK